MIFKDFLIMIFIMMFKNSMLALAMKNISLELPLNLF